MGIGNKTLVSRTCLYAFMVLLFTDFFSPSVSLAGSMLVTESGKGRYPLELYLEVLEDKEKRWTIQEVVTDEFDSKFAVNRNATINLGYTDSAYWIRFRLKNSSYEENWILEYGKPHMDRIELYLPALSGGYTVIKAGDLQPFANREVQHPNFLFPLNLSFQKEITVYLRLHSTSAIIVPLTLWAEESFARHDHKRQLALGFYYGLMIVMILYNLFLYLSLKDRSYFYYVLYMSCIAFGISVSNGISFELFWPTLPWWQNHALKFFYCLGNWFLILFARSFLDTKHLIRHLDSVLFFLMIAAVILLFLSFFISVQAFVNLMFVQFVIIILILAASLISLRQKHRPARFFFIAFSLTFVGIVVTPLRLRGLIPETFITLYSIQIASAMEAVLLSLALADRINILRKDRERAMEAVYTGEIKYRRIFENMQAPYFEISPDGIIEEISPSIEKKLLYKAEELIGLSILDLTDDLETHAAMTKLLLAEEELNGEEIQIKDKDGSRSAISVSAKLVKDNNGKIIKIIGSLHDISQRKQAQQALLESEAKYRLLVETSNDFILIIGMDGRLSYANKAALKMSGYGKDEILKTHFLDHMAEEFIGPMVENFSKRQQGMKEFFFYELEFTTKKGERLLVEINTSLIIEDQKPSGIQVTGRDITERKQTEEVLKKAHDELEKKVEERTADYKKAKEEAELANSLKSEFVANMSHELRTPMHHILAYSKLGERRIKKASQEKLRSYFSQINRSGERLLVLLNGLLDLSKLESGRSDFEMKNTDLVPMLAKQIAEFSSANKEKSILFEMKKPELLTTVFCDELKIDQVINNLLANAVKFTPSGKPIAVSLNAEKLSHSNTVSNKKTIPALAVRIKDEGIGIPESELETIFEKFVQSSRTKTNAGGTGLGLSICQEIIKAHHGRIWADNNPEGGATICFVLPYKQ